MVISYFNNIKTSQSDAQEISWHRLYHADRHLPLPFSLTLSDSDQLFIAEKIARIIPSKRVVIYGSWGGKPVVAKLFYERRKARRHAKRDMLGVDALVSASIPTPKLLYKGTAKHQRTHVLLFERIFDALSLDVIWRDKLHTAEVKPLLHAITIELATQHVMGILQRDLHPKNFLITSNKIYTLDGGDIKKLPDRLSKNDSLNHLALFFSQLGIGHDALCEELLNSYANARGWNLKDTDISLVNKAHTKHLQNRWQRYQKKIMRDCSAFSRLDTPQELIIFDREYQSKNLISFFHSPDAVFDFPNTTTLKAGRSATVAKIHLDHHRFVVKRYNIKNAWHWLRRCFRPTRATKSWRLAQYLYLMGIPTAKPIAIIEKRRFGLRSHSYFLMDYARGVHVGEYFSNYNPENPEFLDMATQVVELFKNLASLGLIHDDLKMTNILISKNKPVLIDLDGMYESNNLWRIRRGIKKEIRRFMKNWEDNTPVYQLFEGLFKKLL